jgi:hypothetical protein
MVSSKSEQCRIQPDREPDRQESARCNSRQRRLLVSLSAIDPKQSFPARCGRLLKGVPGGRLHTTNEISARHKGACAKYGSSIIAVCASTTGFGDLWPRLVDTAHPLEYTGQRRPCRSSWPSPNRNLAGIFASNLPAMYHATSVVRPVLILIRILRSR